MNNDEPATRRDIENVITLMRQQSENTLNPIQQLAERIDQRFEALENAMNRRFEAIETRLDRMNDTLLYVHNQIGGLLRWADRLDKNQSTLAATQAAQQKAIDDLAARVTRLEQRLQ